MRKADYRLIAPTFDEARGGTSRTVALWLDRIAEQHATPRNLTVTDLGCGTGKFAVPFAYRYGFQTTGIDASRSMLAIARSKDPRNRVRWIEADVEKNLGGPSDIFFMSHLVHHLDDPPALFDRLFDHTKPRGSTWVRLGAFEDISNDLVHRFFPWARVVDAARTPSVAAVEGWLERAGYQHVRCETITQRSFESVEQRLHMVRLKGTSVLTLLDDDEFARGLEKLERYARDRPDDPDWFHDRMSLVGGFRPR